MYTRPIRVNESGEVAIGVWGDTLGGVLWWREGGITRRALGRLRDTTSVLPSTRVLTFHEEGDGTLWVGTEGDGLLRLAPGDARARAWTTENSDLPHDNVQGILPDDRGFMWISTSNGLARFDQTSERFWAFGENAGINGPRFFADAVHKSEEGHLIFGGPRGLTVVDPDLIDPAPAGSAIVLTGWRVHGREMPVEDALAETGIDLPPSDNFFTFDFSALDFIDPTKVRYRYRLDPLEKEWVEAGNRGTANYTTVPPGRYTLRVTATNSEGVETTDGLAIPVRVRAPYYTTLWFRSLMAFLLLGLISAAYGYRVRQLRARQELRLRIAGRLHDDVGANLSALALRLGMLRGARGLDDQERERVQSLGALARETAHKVREIVWVVNTKYDTVAGLLAKMRDAVDTMLGDQPMSVDAEIPAPGDQRRVDMRLRQDVYLMFKEALHNVVKHSGARSVSVSVQWDDPRLTWQVQDDGRGFDPQGSVEGNGLDLMRARAARHGGQLSIESAVGRGTTVRYSTTLGR